MREVQTRFPSYARLFSAAFIPVRLLGSYLDLAPVARPSFPSRALSCARKRCRRMGQIMDPNHNMCALPVYDVVYKSALLRSAQSARLPS